MERDNFPTFRRIGRGLAGWSARRRQGLVEWVHRDWLGRLRRLGIGLLVLFVVLAIPWTYFNITLGMKLEEELEDIREAGQPLTLQEAVPEMPPREENAAYVYEEAFRVFQSWEPTPEGAVPGVMRGTLNPEMQKELEEFAEGRPEALPDEARQWLFSDEVEQRLDAIKRASEMERCVFPVNWQDGYGALFPHFAQFRAAQRLVTARMMIAGREGRTEEALEWCEVGLRMSNHISEEPTLIGFLVRVGMIEMLSRGVQDTLDDVTLSTSEVRSLRGIIMEEDLWQHLDRAMEAERALGLSLFDGGHQVQDYIPDESPADRQDLWALYYSPIGAPLRKNDQQTFLDLYELLIERMEHPWREVGNSWPDRQEYAALGGRTAPMTMVLMPVFSRAPMKRDAAIARRDQFNIALALNLYRQEHGEYPRTLEPLAGTVDWPIPDDIFSGEPFGYRREGDGYVLWSVGPDLDDDGGVSADDAGASWFEDSDIVWRVSG